MGIILPTNFLFELIASSRTGLFGSSNGSLTTLSPPEITAPSCAYLQYKWCAILFRLIYLCVIEPGIPFLINFSLFFAKNIVDSMPNNYVWIFFYFCGLIAHMVPRTGTIGICVPNIYPKIDVYAPDASTRVLVLYWLLAVDTKCFYCYWSYAIFTTFSFKQISAPSSLAIWPIARHNFLGLHSAAFGSHIPPFTSGPMPGSTFLRSSPSKY